MMLDRRSLLGLLFVGALAPASNAHTLYNQWVVFRQKHLLIGCHRKDPVTYDLARELAAALNHHLPKASARAARAPHPERLASLLGTGQIFLSILSEDHAQQMREGDGPFTPYGAIPLSIIWKLDSYVLVGHMDFPKRHAWMVAHTLQEAGYGTDGSNTVPGMPTHPGAIAALENISIEDLTASNE